MESAEYETPRVDQHEAGPEAEEDEPEVSGQVKVTGENEAEQMEMIRENTTEAYDDDDDENNNVGNDNNTAEQTGYGEPRDPERPNSETGSRKSGSRTPSERFSRPASASGGVGSRPASQTGSRKSRSRPGSGKYGGERPESGRPTSGRPTSGRPGSGTHGTETDRPSSRKSDHGTYGGTERPSSGRPGSKTSKTGTPRPDSGRVGSGRASTERVGSGRSASGRIGSGKGTNEYEQPRIENGYGEQNEYTTEQGYQNGYEDKYSEIFNHLDPGSTGSLSRDELVIALRLAGHNPTRDEIDQLLAHKQDYEGVTLQEFRVLASQKDTGTLRQEMLDAFSVLDRGTGRISRPLLRLLCSGEDSIISIEEVEELLEAANIKDEDDTYSTTAIVDLMVE